MRTLQAAGRACAGSWRAWHPPAVWPRCLKMCRLLRPRGGRGSTARGSVQTAAAPAAALGWPRIRRLHTGLRGRTWLVAAGEFLAGWLGVGGLAWLRPNGTSRLELVLVAAATWLCHSAERPATMRWLLALQPVVPSGLDWTRQRCASCLWAPAWPQPVLDTPRRPRNLLSAAARPQRLWTVPHTAPAEGRRACKRTGSRRHLRSAVPLRDQVADPPVAVGLQDVGHLHAAAVDDLAGLHDVHVVRLDVAQQPLQRVPSAGGRQSRAAGCGGPGTL